MLGLRCQLFPARHNAARSTLQLELPLEPRFLATLARWPSARVQYAPAAAKLPPQK